MYSHSPSDRDSRRGDRPTLPPIRDLFRDELSRSTIDPASLARLSVADDGDRYPHERDGRMHPQSPPRPPSGRPPPRSPTLHAPFDPRSPRYFSPQPQRSPLQPPLRHASPLQDDVATHYRSETYNFPTHHPPHDYRSPLSAGNGELGAAERIRPRYSESRSPYPPSQLGPSFSAEGRSPQPPQPPRRYHEYEREPARSYRTTPTLEGHTHHRPRTTISTAVGQSGSAAYQSDDEQTPVARYQPKAAIMAATQRSGPSSFPQEADSSHPRDGSSGSKYECNYCGKGFNRPSSLKIHLNSHTGEKPFVCPVVECGRRFSVLSNMRRHARVHKSEPESGEEDSGLQRRLSTASSTSGTRSSPPVSDDAGSTGGYHVRRNSSTSSGSSRKSWASSLSDDDDGRPEKRTRHRKAAETITT